MKAQIFLSCGQDRKRGEDKIAEAIKKKIEDSDLGFDCWVASEEQDLNSLRDVVFKHLEESDYFVFVDFKREELEDEKDGNKKEKPIHRGSLFANQELAVASYIGLADCVLLLQEEGVEEHVGVLSAVLAKPLNSSGRGQGWRPLESQQNPIASSMRRGFLRSRSKQ